MYHTLGDRLVMLWQRIKEALLPRQSRPDPDRREWEYNASKPASVPQNPPETGSEFDLVEDRVWQDLEMEMVFFAVEPFHHPIGGAIFAPSLEPI